jgi:hypothetical protein
MSAWRRPALLLLASLVLSPARAAAAQESDPGWRVGLGASYGTQRTRPFGNRNYLHDLTGYKLQANRGLWAVGALGLELQLEPTVYRVRHRLLNQYFWGPSHGPDHLAESARFQRGESYEEVALNVGLVARAQVLGPLSLFVLGGVGPMWSFDGTERLARGFAFTDVIAAGAGLRMGDALLEVRPGLRHESNLQTQLPNSGHNETVLDVALSFEL